MSADKDRGIRRQKQKRAKQIKKAARQPRVPETGKTLETQANIAS